MKTIGLLGGMSWESSAEYYRIVNQRVRDRLGGLHSARCLLYSVDFADVERMQVEGRWDDAGDLLLAAGRSLQAGGADLLVLCTNTMHKVADRLESGLRIPVLHLADTTAAAVQAAGLRRVGLLGTAFTMEQGFYRDRLAEHGLEVLVPGAADRETVHRIIYQELVRGVVDEGSRAAYRSVIARLVGKGVEGVVLGCTEIELLIGPGDSPVPVFPTTRLHAEAAVDHALAGPPSAPGSTPDAAGPPSLDGRFFRSGTDVAGGDVGAETTFAYRQDGDLVWARYAGGSVRLGFLVGTRSGDSLDFRYSHVDRDGATANGHCTSTIRERPDGRLQLDERWWWESRPGHGTSLLVEDHPGSRASESGH